MAVILGMRINEDPFDNQAGVAEGVCFLDR